MANKRVTLVLRAKTDKGWRRLPVVIGNNGRLRPGCGLVSGEPIHFKDHVYELRRYEGSKMLYSPATPDGNSAADAFAAWKREQRAQEARVGAEAAGVRVVPQAAQSRSLKDDVGRFLQRTKDAGHMEAAQTYGVALDEFMAAVNIDRADQIDPDVMLRFHAALRRKRNGDRTIANKHAAVKAFILWRKLDKNVLGRAPRYEKKVPKAYGRDVISTLMATAKSELMGVTIDVLRMAGLREQEAIYLQWSDIDFHRSILKVRSKPELDFMVKDKEERDVPMPKELVKTLKAWRKKYPRSTWVLGTQGDKPQLHMLRALKRLAKRAGLNCGSCPGCQSKHKECREFTLHAFRRSYATALARANVDVHAIRDLLGHSDLQTTLRYLASMKTEDKRAAVNSVKW
jgi:integrase